MAQASSSLGPPDAANALATVRLDVRSGAGRVNVYEVGDGGFLIGSVPGCDLRLPGSNLPPIICLIARGAASATLRRLAPVLPILVNGKASSSAYLQDGDRVGIGPIDIGVSVVPVEPAPTMQEPLSPIEEREQRLREQLDQLEDDRAEWHRCREEIEAECRRRAAELQAVVQHLQTQEQEQAATRADLAARENALRAEREEMIRRQQETEALSDESRKHNAEAAALRREVAEIKQQLYQRYHERRERLVKQQQAIHKVARRLAQRKQRLDTGEAELAAFRQEWEQKQIDIEGRGEQVQRERQLLDEQHRLIVSRQQEVQRDLSERFADVQVREAKLIEAEAALEKGQKQHQADLVRLDRIQATLEQRQKQLQATALEVDHRYEQLQRDTRDLEEHAAQLDEWHNRLLSDTERLTEQKKEQEAITGQLDQRAAALEGQQAMLATLRTRLERMREEIHREEQALSDQRVLQEASETDLRTRLAEAERMRAEVENDRQLQAEERRRFEERRAIMEAAVAQLRQARATLEGEEKELREQQEQVRSTAADQAEQIALLTARSTQLEAEQIQLSDDRQALREREMALVRAEQALASLQEQVRRRVEEVSEKQRAAAEEEQRLQQEAARLDEQAKNLEQDRQLTDSRLNLGRQELGTRATELDAQARTLAQEQEKLRIEQQQVEEASATLGSQRQVHAAERIAFEVERQKTQEETTRTRSELEASRQEILDLGRTLPELEMRASAILDRLTQAREQMREHLTEVHQYVRQSREDLEVVRRDFQAEAERVRQQELALRADRDEHRLATAAFRQQVIEWDGRIAELKQALHLDGTRLERRASEVSEQAQRVADTSARLAEQAEQLQHKERLVTERRGEVDRHLIDMREWYRRKMRELAGLENDPVEAPRDEETAHPGEATERGILSLTGEVDPGDRQLGDLLRSLELIDGDTLTTLLLEARRQRRSLRQLLLAGNYLTLYQMALIEAGNLDGLVLGPVRVIDRLQATPREAVYRVFDPRRSRELLLRHLAESEMEDAVRPDEFRQRFAAASAVRHENLAATLEVLEIADRPAVLQEWLHGLPSTDWPALAGAPGVWHRLLSQAALALHTAHTAGLLHGHLHASSFVFTRDGVLKLCGLGEPRWLAVPAPQESDEPSVASDLAALGHIAAAWAAVTPTTKSGKNKGLPDKLHTILARFHHENEAKRYTGTAALLEDLDRAGAEVPANAAAWDRFVRQVRDESTDTALRESA
jgi:hypothetical protein